MVSEIKISSLEGWVNYLKQQSGFIPTSPACCKVVDLQGPNSACLGGVL